MMHGGGGNAAHSEQIYGWDQQVDTGKFIVAYPDGLGIRYLAWNVDGSGDSSNRAVILCARMSTMFSSFKIW